MHTARTLTLVPVLAAGLALAALSLAPASARAACGPVPGDVDGSGAVAVPDVQCAILGVLAQLLGAPEPGCLDGSGAADLSCDGDTTVADVAMCIGIAIGEGLSPALDADGDTCADACQYCGDAVCDSGLGEGCADCQADCGPCVPGGCCTSNADCEVPGAPAECVGTVCKAVPPAGSCWSHGDCGPEEVCDGAFVCPCGALCGPLPDVLGTCKAVAGGCCLTAEDCAGNDPYPTCAAGNCIPMPPTGCWGDEHCGAGATCEGENVCPCGAFCLVADWPGSCEAHTRMVGGGWSFGFCGGPCKGEIGWEGRRVTYTVSGWDGTVYEHYTGTLTDLGAATAMGVANGLVGTTLQGTYGCPDCADGGASRVDLVRMDSASSHAFEYFQPPAVLAAADAFMHGLMDALSGCQTTNHVAPDACP